MPEEINNILNSRGLEVFALIRKDYLTAWQENAPTGYIDSITDIDYFCTYINCSV
jgi:hypothetical protein